MKITPLQYAKALFAETEHASERETQDVVARFAERLQRDGQARDLNRIIGKFAELWNASRGIIEAEVTSRASLGVEDAALIKRSLLERYRAKEVVITNRVDSAIGGGVIVRVGDELLDGSITTQLATLRKQLRSH
jgi:F-type H+-transporting ATPase subunit delta